MNLSKTKLRFSERFGTLLDFLDKMLSSLGFFEQTKLDWGFLNGLETSLGF